MKKSNVYFEHMSLGKVKLMLSGDFWTFGLSSQISAIERCYQGMKGCTIVT